MADPLTGEPVAASNASQPPDGDYTTEQLHKELFGSTTYEPPGPVLPGRDQAT